MQVPVCRLQPLSSLSPAQEKAYSEIHDTFTSKDVCLLHGVTSSGKTEIYVRLIDEVLKLGRQVLYMLPEIAITTQITERLAKLFGNKLLVYHSKFSDNERVEVWNKLLHGNEPMVVLGVRSSLFLPFNNLGLIIVDEEHENTYKQQDPALVTMPAMLQSCWRECMGQRRCWDLLPLRSILISMQRLVSMDW